MPGSVNRRQRIEASVDDYFKRDGFSPGVFTTCFNNRSSLIE
jgi:hypothetical protein